MAASTPEKVVEWVGGLLKVPAYVTHDGEPYRPEVLFWLDENGVVLSSQVSKPGTLLPAAAEILEKTIGQPLFGKERCPTAVRVASPQLARLLRSAHPELEIRCAPTPELDALALLLLEKFAERRPPDHSYLSGGADAHAMAGFFDAAADLFQAAPWRVIDSDQHLLSISIEALGLKHAVLSIVGQLGNTRGLVLFGSYADFKLYLAAGAALARGERPQMPAHFSLCFERGSEISPALRKQILSHAWRVAGADAFPWMKVTDEDLIPRLPTAKEVNIAELIARLLPKLLEESRATLKAAWSGGDPFMRRLNVTTAAGSFTVSVVAADKLDGQLHWAVDEVLSKVSKLRELDLGAAAPVISEV
jgi:hypothetical protein